MKRFSLVLFCWVLCILSCSAQSTSLSVSFGSGFTNTRSTDFQEKYKRGYILDFSLQHSLKSFLSVKTGLNFEQKGSQDELSFCATGESENPYNVHYEYYYATLPVLANFSFGKKFKYNFYVGPYFSALLGTALDDNDQFRNEEILQKAGNYKPIDFGLSIGTSLEIPVSDDLFIPIEVRYNRGLLNTSREQLYMEDMVVKHGAVYVMLGVRKYLSVSK